MSKIRVLPPAVAERIAAGEVVERPASVVKELLENSLDAGATEVAVILEDGGKRLLEILDNGRGMAAEDLGLCLERHATSKLATLDDLERIATLGFRGEALPSIAAVSELSIVSRTGNEEAAHEVRAGTPGAARPIGPTPITFGHFLGSPHGTRVRAAGLFSQVPARLKFLRSASAEVAQVRDWLERLALSHPRAGFRLVSDDRTLLRLPPASEPDRVRAVLSDGEDYPLLNEESQNSLRDAGIKARIYWLQGLTSPQTRRLVQVVNGRAVRDRLLQQALLAPFRQALLPGQFPAAALFVDVDPAKLDVNVHPAKAEVRFLDSSAVFRSVQWTASRLLERTGAPAFAAGAASKWESAGTPIGEPVASTVGSAPASWGARDPSQYAQGSWTLNPPATPGAGTALPTPSHPLSSARYAGALFDTYLVFDLGMEAALVDQHAAHERIRFETLLARALGAESPASQQLLIPEAAAIRPEDRTELERRLPWLARIGFDAELFGEQSVLFRAIPPEWGTDSLRVRLGGLVERLLAAGELQTDTEIRMDETLFEKLASEACHSSVRAGDRLDALEARALVDRLFLCTHPWNCPHGRPTVARVPRARFEEWFQRRV